ncbi:unnamed protein product [Ilex paraguariensis]|uniref:F-box domain-containing protein n=1 Tax=Ilex paraguariensis TaxID=185542 RepID=A0ABC8UUH8_9AQUA
MGRVSGYRKQITLYQRTADLIKQPPLRSSMDELPLDIVFDFFSRIPIEMLFRFRCVSKLWCNMIDHPSLAIMHITRATEGPTPLLLSDPMPGKSTMSIYLAREKGRTLETRVNPLVEFDLNSFHTEGSCNGLLYFAEFAGEGIVTLSNPLRREFQRLPPIKILSPNLRRFKTYGLGFDISTNTFKMICVFLVTLNSEASGYSLGTLVHTLKTSSWKEISEVPPYPIRGKPVFAYGALHWIVDPLFVSHNLIVSFDVGKEKFNSISLANFDSKDSNLFRLVDLNGDLGMTDLSSNEKIEIWVMKDYAKKEWVRKYIIYIGAPDGKPDNGHIEVVGLWKHGEILLRSSEGYFFYSKEKGLRYTQTSGIKLNSSVYIYRKSLVSLSKVMEVL